jgi:hypothetical protein
MADAGNSIIKGANPILKALKAAMENQGFGPTQSSRVSKEDMAAFGEAGKHLRMSQSHIDTLAKQIGDAVNANHVHYEMHDGTAGATQLYAGLFEHGGLSDAQKKQVLGAISDRLGHHRQLLTYFVHTPTEAERVALDADTALIHEKLGIAPEIFEASTVRAEKAAEAIKPGMRMPEPTIVPEVSAADAEWVDGPMPSHVQDIDPFAEHPVAAEASATNTARTVEADNVKAAEAEKGIFKNIGMLAKNHWGKAAVAGAVTAGIVGAVAWNNGKARERELQRRGATQSAELQRT